MGKGGPAEHVHAQPANCGQQRRWTSHSSSSAPTTPVAAVSCHRIWSLYLYGHVLLLFCYYFSALSGDVTLQGPSMGPRSMIGDVGQHTLPCSVIGQCRVSRAELDPGRGRGMGALAPEWERERGWSYPLKCCQVGNQPTHTHLG